MCEGCARILLDVDLYDDGKGARCELSTCGLRDKHALDRPNLTSTGNWICEFRVGEYVVMVLVLWGKKT